MSLIIRTIEQLFQQYNLLATDLLIFRRPTAIGPSKEYKITLEDFLAAFDEHLDSDSDIGTDHFKGVYVTLVALQTAHPTAESGDYAYVDAGVGEDALMYIWDDPDGWIQGGGTIPSDLFDSDFTISLSGGKSLGKFTNGQIVPAAGLSAKEVLLLAAIEYINPSFGSFGVTGQSLTIESGTTLSGNRTTTWTITLGSGTVLTIDIYDITAAANLVSNTPNDGSQVVTITTIQLNGNGSTQQWRGILHDTGQVPTLDVNSSTVTVTSRFLRFYDPVATTPITSAEVRALTSAFHTGVTTFNVLSGTVFTEVDVYLPPGVTISSVTDLDALGADLTANFVLQGTFNVLDAGGTSRAYNHYKYVYGVPYSTSHRLQIITAN